MRKLIVGLLFATAAAYPADIFSFGVKGGVPLNDAFNAGRSGSVSYITQSKRFVVGPEIELNLPFGLGIEVDALYRRLQFNSDEAFVNTLIHGKTTANSWDFPLLVKKRFGEGAIKPYVSAGATFRNLTNVERVETFFSGSNLQNQTTGNPSSLRDNFTTGFTAAGGLQLGVGIVRISPEIRYTRWGWDSFRSVDSLLKSNSDQWDFLVGITF